MSDGLDDERSLTARSAGGFPAEDAQPTFAPLVALDPDARADVALRTVHRALLEAVVAAEVGVREVQEGEFLHDFRVAVRRTRTGLRQVKRVYPRDAARRFADGFRQLAASTGDARDLEVFLGSRDELADPLGSATIDALAPLWAALRGAEAEHRRRCSELLAAPEYERLIDDWSDFLALPPPAVDAPDNAARPVREVAGEHIARAYGRVAALERAVDPESSADAFHRLRLECKKLRYLLEFFGDLFDADQTASFVAYLRDTQDALGLINDLRVQRGLIEDAGAAPCDALDRLAAHIDQQQRLARHDFVADFAVFVSPATRSALERLLSMGTNE